MKVFRPAGGRGRSRRVTPFFAGDRAAVAELITASPHLIDVLGWHEGLCGACGLAGRCPEYHEIIAEYGAGPYGAAVFWPSGPEVPGGPGE